MLISENLKFFIWSC